MPSEINVSGGRWVQSEKDTVVRGSIPIGTAADTWVTVASVNEECLVLYAGVSRDASSVGTISMRIIKDGVEFGSVVSVTGDGSALVGEPLGHILPLHCEQSLEIQVKNSQQTSAESDGRYSLSFSKGEMQ